MLITNSTTRKLRLSQFRDISEDGTEEINAWIVPAGSGLNIPEIDNLVITEED